MFLLLKFQGDVYIMLIDLKKKKIVVEFAPGVQDKIQTQSLGNDIYNALYANSMYYKLHGLQLT